jgi:hypothetical protein
LEFEAAMVWKYSSGTMVLITDDFLNHSFPSVSKKEEQEK